ncbi:MAG: FKBP-type peptidyl-prolyl cis-trans isomerase FklB [Acidobacteriaceae bacterium]|nr:FKBP-type peptidyl-prolyl cis-trans isomerase FklB [Acidobacteriaceae bacterium]
MQRSFRSTASGLAAGIVLLGGAAAQQTPAKPAQSTATTTHRRTTTAAAKPKPPALTTEKDKQSYAIGLNVGKSLHRDDIDIDPKIVLQGLQDAMAGGAVRLTDDQIKTVMTDLQSQVRQKQEEKRLALAESNKKDGAAFLAANATKPGVVTLPSGLQYKILTPGTGPKPTATDSVICNYRGTLLDNTEFDSSYKRGPATFPVTGVIKGWTEALQLMPVGSKWQLFIPADLAYGDRGREPIQPNATLVFELELMSIAPKTPPEVTPGAAATQPPPQ